MRHATASSALVLLAACSGVASAGEGFLSERSFVQNATGACQAALSIYDGAIRKRPLALQNEGAANAFVSCSMVGTDRTSEGLNNVYVTLHNNNGAPVEVTCTLVAGLGGQQTVHPKSREVPADSGNTSIYYLYWDGAAASTGFEDTVNVSCNLPPGTGLGSLWVYYSD